MYLFRYYISYKQADDVDKMFREFYIIFKVTKIVNLKEPAMKSEAFLKYACRSCHKLDMMTKTEFF